MNGPLEIQTKNTMTCDMDNFYLLESLKVLLNDEVFFEKCWEETVPRLFS